MSERIERTNRRTRYGVCAGLAMGFVCAAWGAGVPVVENVRESQVGNGSGKLTVTYDLVGAKAIVTFDAETNCVDAVTGAERWATIGHACLGTVTGDCFCEVEPGSNRSFTWNARRYWPRHKVAKLRAVVKAVALDQPPNYLVCDLTTGTRRYYDDADYLPGGIQSDNYRKQLLLMRKIPARGVTWDFGAPSWKLEYDSTQDTPHQVGFTHDYYMGVFEVTQWQWYYVAVTNKGCTTTYTPTWPGDTRPFDSGGTILLPYILAGNTYDMPPWPNGTDADYALTTGVVKKFRDLTGLGLHLHLPTQWQWEYACRAGTRSAFNDGSELGTASEATNAGLDQLGRYAGNGGETLGTARVGSYAPNAWGLYDMHGNVKEWCRDHRGWNKVHGYSSTTNTVYVDPIGSTEAAGAVGTHFNYRGGDYASTPRQCASNWRSDSIQVWSGGTTLGFRLCYTIIE